ncbi:MAG: radical SAM family heme chaperone HemW [Bacteroidia bacterium]|nr:radical SAM family heme chaperone HemW [Bacteroidia bacterium]
MAGIYIHIPFCKQACNYCNFHFSTNLSYKEKLVQSIAKELFLRRDFFENETIDTVYFGGGTPSILNEKELHFLINALHKNFDLSMVIEFTLEANPDDLSHEFLGILKDTPINRLSIGIQSFFDYDLHFMNRAHSAEDALNCVNRAHDIGINKISIDLIYGVPNMSVERWEQNLDIAFSLPINHLSSYCLTVEPKTFLHNQIKNNKLPSLDENISEAHFMSLIRKAEIAGFEQYEISNFAKNEAYAKHNTAYWKGEKYLGVGPGAHSFTNHERSWNISNNHEYMRSLENNLLALEKEELTLQDRYNEWVMTGLRTKWGINLSEGNEVFGSDRINYLQKQLQKYVEKNQIVVENDCLVIAKSARFLADGIAADAFMV